VAKPTLGGTPRDRDTGFADPPRIVYSPFRALLALSGRQMSQTTREPQYQFLLHIREQKGLTRLGVMANQVWHDDPRRLAFTFARYKFVAKMMSGRTHVIEIGCADAFASRIVLQEVEKLTVIDFDPVFIHDVKSRMDPDWQLEAHVHDMVGGPFAGQFDGAYALDVLEHIQPHDEDTFLANITSSLIENAVAIFGMPSLESQAYASLGSKIGHVNCKTAHDFKTLLARHFRNVFIFSMNDEIVHTGFSPMAHYLLALCVSPI
jgi:2-polyprenyl-3-methyl-5-hydroxy-6-metoxy-1,4-benzoquinol methylase